MFAIFKRELRSYFTSLVGYVVIGVMLAFTGLYYSANCLVYGTSDFSTVLYSTTLVMLFLLPALTMRSFADERRNKTDQLLLTSPVGIPSIVMGKYFAQLAVFAVPMAAAAIMPLVLTAFGTISLTSAYATWLAYFLMGAACIAIGTFVSALTENQIIAYLATFGALLICYLMNGIKSLFKSRKGGQLGMGLLVGTMDIATANNTVAIVMANPIAKEMSQDYGISPRKTASLLDTFSCIFQGILPYGAQMLVALSAASELGHELSAFQVIPNLFYPFLLLISSLLFIFVLPPRKGDTL